MVEYVRESHELDAEGRAIVIAAGVHQQGRFYDSLCTFHVLESCNVWVARALQPAGLAVHPDSAITAGTLVRRVRRLSVAAPAATR